MPKWRDQKQLEFGGLGQKRGHKRIDLSLKWPLGVKAAALQTVNLNFKSWKTDRIGSL